MTKVNLLHDLAPVVEAVQPGEWASWGDVATVAGYNPYWARAASKMRWQPGLPWWRVQRADGLVRRNWYVTTLSNYPTTRWQLQREGVRFEGDKADKAQRVSVETLRARLS